MALKQDLHSYQARWKAVEEIQAQERKSASLELRWRQLNAAYGIAKGLGLLQPDLSEMEVFERWAKLKEKTTDRPPKV
jgi:N-acetylglutamate synthase/N-acetylornithine aminotransferase